MSVMCIIPPFTESSVEERMIFSEGFQLGHIVLLGGQERMNEQGGAVATEAN